MNRVMNYLIVNKIATVSDLELFFDEVYGKYHDLGNTVRQLDGRRKELEELLRDDESAKKYQPIVDKLNTIHWKGKKEKYKAAHDRELTIYYASRRRLENTNGNPTAWKRELEQIQKESAERTHQRSEMKGDVDMLFQIKNAVNQVLREEQKSGRPREIRKENSLE